jgi:hypothetical protein
MNLSKLAKFNVTTHNLQISFLRAETMALPRLHRGNVSKKGLTKCEVKLRNFLVQAVVADPRHDSRTKDFLYPVEKNLEKWGKFF